MMVLMDQVQIRPVDNRYLNREYEPWIANKKKLQL